MKFIFPFVYTIWFVSEFLISRLKRSTPGDAKGADRNSLATIWLVVVPSIAGASVIASTIYLPMGNPSIRYAGLGVMVAGIVLRMLVIRALGRFFTVDVTIRTDHQLKTDGFYRYVRHPSYSAALLTFAGFGLSLNNWLSLLIVVVASLSVFLYRIKVEEEALEKQFGAAYVSYIKGTKAIIPFVY